MKATADEFKKELKRTGVSQADLAKVLGIDPSRLNHWLVPPCDAEALDGALRKLRGFPDRLASHD